MAPSEAPFLSPASSSPRGEGSPSLEEVEALLALYEEASNLASLEALLKRGSYSEDDSILHDTRSDEEKADSLFFVGTLGALGGVVGVMLGLAGGAAVAMMGASENQQWLTFWTIVVTCALYAGVMPLVDGNFWAWPWRLLKDLPRWWRRRTFARTTFQRDERLMALLRLAREERASREVVEEGYQEVRRERLKVLREARQALKGEDARRVRGQVDAILGPRLILEGRSTTSLQDV